MPDRWPVVGLTGHRPRDLPAGSESWVRDQIARCAAHLRDTYGTEWAASGLALGSDQWWAAEALVAGLRLWAHVPAGQADRWPESAVERWELLLGQAEKVTRYGESYHVRHLHERNAGMVAVSSAMLAVWDGRTSGGTAGCVRLIERAGLPWVRLDPVARRVWRVTGRDVAPRRTRPAVP